MESTRTLTIKMTLVTVSLVSLTGCLFDFLKDGGRQDGNVIEEMNQETEPAMEAPDTVEAFAAAIINPDTISPEVSVTFVDAATGEILEDVEISGNVAIETLTDSPTLPFVVTTGELSFGVENSLGPDVIELTIAAVADGYFATSLPVTLPAGDRLVETLSLVSLNDPPEGVSVATADDIAVVDGMVQQEVNLEIDPTDPEASPTEVLIAAGTILTDALGEPLNGEVTVSVATFDSINEIALQSFPGGMTGRLEANESVDEEVLPTTLMKAKKPDQQKKIETVNFSTAGLIAIKACDESGKVAANSSKPIQTAIGLNENTVNPQTGDVVRKGDVIPLWSFDPGTGRWSSGGDTTVTLTKDNRLNAKFNLKKFAYYNLDWKFKACQMGGVLTIEGNDGHAPIEGIVRYKSTNTRVSRLNVSNGNMKFFNAPRGIPAIVELYSPYYTAPKSTGSTAGAESVFLGSVDFADLCSEQKIIPVQMPQSSALNIDVQALCDGKAMAFEVPVRYRLLGTTEWRSRGLSHGKNIFTGLLPDANYEIAVSLMGEWYTATINSTAKPELEFDLPLTPATCSLLKNL